MSNRNVIIDVMPEAGRSAEDKDLERQYKVACKKLGINPKQTLQNHMRKIIADSQEKDRKFMAINLHQDN